MSEEKFIIQKLESIEKMLKEQNLLKKEVLTFNEAAVYLEVSHSHLYKMTSTGLFHRTNPTAKNCISTGRNWICGCSQTSYSKEEIEQQAADFLYKKGRGSYERDNRITASTFSGN